MILWNQQFGIGIMRYSAHILEQNARTRPGHLERYEALVSSKWKELARFVYPGRCGGFQGSEQEQVDMSDYHRLVMQIAALHISALPPSDQASIFSYWAALPGDYSVESADSTNSRTSPSRTSSKTSFGTSYTGLHGSGSRPPSTNDCN